MIENSIKKLGFKKPIVGVHIRRTDKVGTEAAFHNLGEYMKWVDEYYDQLEMVQYVEKRRIFLASDDRRGEKKLSNVSNKFDDVERSILKLRPIEGMKLLEIQK